MKRKWSLLAAAGVVAVVSSAALSSSVTVTRMSGTFAGDGGEFNIERTSGSVGILGGPASPQGAPANSFQSFCLELGQSVTLGDSYDVVISNNVDTGTGAPISVPSGFSAPNPFNGRSTIAAGTAWLYEAFRAGTLNSYTYTVGSGRENSARDLQIAIWIYQNQIEPNDPTYTNDFLDAASNALTDPTADYTGSRVRALNMTDSSGQKRQDMLTIIPLPSGGGLAAAGLLGLVALRRRRA